MEVNSNLRKDLMVDYLFLLTKSGNTQVFGQLYPLVENYIGKIVGDLKDTEYLNRINAILSFRKESIEIGVIK